MSAKLVPTIKTTFTQKEFVKALIGSWKNIYNVLPTKQQIGVIFAQWSIETGQGKFCWNNNIGNVKYIPSKNPENDNVEYMMLKNTWEIIKGEKIIFQPPSPQTWFRSFITLQDGVTFHLNFLRSNKYAKVWTAVEAGDPDGFAKLLKEVKYYTAPEALYIRNMHIHFDKFIKDNLFDEVLEEFKKENNTSVWSSITNVFKKTFGTV